MCLPNSKGGDVKLEEAKGIADKYVEILRPYCLRIEVAGSVRREKPEVKDIEIVAIPIALIGFSNEVNKLEKVKGKSTGKYTQRILPEGIKLDLFMANIRNWGLIFAIRTGSAEFSHKVLARGWVKKGYHSVGGMLYRDEGEIDEEEIEVREEQDLFDLIGVPYIEPKLREANNGQKEQR
jgi:DNA polymerase/3'-5' exonuclease PolX